MQAIAKFISGLALGTGSSSTPADPAVPPSLAAAAVLASGEARNLDSMQPGNRDSLQQAQFLLDSVKRMPSEAAGVGLDGKKRKILMKQLYKCHRAAPDRKSQAAPAPVLKKPKEGKKNAQCPYVEEWVIFEDEPEVVYIFPLHGHMGHTPGDKEDAHYLEIDAELEEEIQRSLLYGLPPDRIVSTLQGRARTDPSFLQGSQVSGACHPVDGLSMAMVENVRKRMLAKTRLDKNDVMAVEKLVKELGTDIILYHHPQQIDGDDIIEHLRLAICTRVQRSMIREFGKEMMFMDAVFGLSRYGFPMLTLVVRDEFGHGFPAAYCISSTEDSVVWQEFLLAVLNEANLDPKDVTFMIDKSGIEISAIEAIGSKYLLCKFHMLQEWERFLKSAESGVSGPKNKDTRKRILWRLSAIQKFETETTFKAESELFEQGMLNNNYVAVVEKYRNGWKGCGDKWARYGRLHVAELESDTNNLVERHFRGLKYSDSGGKVCSRLDDQLILLLKVISKFILKRENFLIASRRTEAARADGNLEFWVNELSDPSKGHISFLNDVLGGADIYGAGSCDSCTVQSQQYHFCLADGSCTCPANIDDICKHVEAAACFPGHGCTVSIIKAGAAEYIRRKEAGQYDLLEINKDDGVFKAAPMACFASPKDIAPGRWLHICTVERTCTCHVFAVHRVCPHLVALLSEEDAEELFTLNKLTNNSAENAAAEELLLLKRRRRLRASPTNEPTAMCSSEVMKLANAEARAAAVVVPTGREALESHIGVTANSITRLSKEATNKTQLRMISSDLKAVEEKVKAVVAKYAKTPITRQKTKTKKGARQPTDRRHHNLDPCRTTTKVKATRMSTRAASAAVAAAYADEMKPKETRPRLQNAKSQYGVRRTPRGLGYLKRNSKAGGSRQLENPNLHYK